MTEHASENQARRAWRDLRERFRRLMHECDLPYIDDQRPETVRFTCPECGRRWAARYVEDIVGVLDGVADASRYEWRALRHNGWGAGHSGRHIAESAS